MNSPPEDGPCEVTITAPDRDWLYAVVRHIVENRLAAAAHVDAMDTIYRWAGSVHFADEARARLHTMSHNLPAIIDCVKQGHPFEVPCVVAIPIRDGEAEYLQWIKVNSNDQGNV